jgi:CheY-like chemotaxis protein
MDMIMPTMNGIEASRLIREFDQQTMIAALTANASIDDREECYEAGMNAFLSKPVNLEALEKLIEARRRDLVVSSVKT